MTRCLRFGLGVSLTTCWLAWSAVAQAASIDFSVPSSSTFLRTEDSDTPFDSTPINLAALGILPGATIDLLRLGDFLYCSSCLPPGLDMVAVFSTSATLDPSNQLNRVPGAIDVGGFRSYVTSPTLFNGFPTDIPQDFAISYGTEPLNGASIVVPASAQFLFVGVPDSFYGDNSDENQDYGVRLSFTPEAAPVPEPASLTLTGLGVFGILARLRRRARSL